MKQRDLRIVFMGTPEFAVGSLKKLLEDKQHIVGVVTAPDKPAGRGRQLQQSAVKQYALAQHLQVLQPNNLKSESFIQELQALDANLFIVVAFRMLPKIVWSMPSYGTFNLHASLLPNYRGAAPIHWAIINGEGKTGVTTFFIDETIDTGAMIRSKELAIHPTETVGTLHDKLMHLGSELVLETVELIAQNKETTTIQPTLNNLKTAPKLDKDNCKIDWNASLNQVYNKIRGLNPFPAAWTTLYNNDETLDIKLYDVQKEEAHHIINNGSIHIDNGTLKIAVENGFIIVKSLQLPGKRKMDSTALLNGYQIDPSAYVV